MVEMPETDPALEKMRARVVLHRVKRSLYDFCVEEQTDPDTQVPYDVARLPSLEELHAWADNFRKHGIVVKIEDYNADAGTFTAYVQPARVVAQINCNDLKFGPMDL